MNKIKKLALALLLLPLSLTAQTADSATYLEDFKAELVKQWPNNRTLSIVFHGHSVPTGYTTGGAVETLTAYSHSTLSNVKAYYPNAVVNVITTSIGGENAITGETRMDDVLAHNPDVLFIDYSLNDRTFDIDLVRAAWASMIEQAQAAGVKVMLCTSTADWTEDILDEENILSVHAAQVRELAAEYQTGLIDSYQIFKTIVENGGSLTTYNAQSNHPNATGHALVAAEIIEWFKPAE